MSAAGYKAVVERVGSSTAFSDEAMSATSVTNQYQIDDATKRIWDRTVTPTFYEDSSEIPASDVDEIDYVFGKVTFATSKSGSISVDGNHLPRQAIVGANAYTLEHAGDTLDDTDYDAAQSNGAFRTRMYGLRDVTASIERFYKLDKHFDDAIKDQEVVVLSIRPGGSGNDYARGFFVMETNELTGEVSSLENQSLNLQLDGDPGIAYNWGT